MTSFKKFAAVTLTSLTLATAFTASAEARPWRHHHRGGVIAAGLLGAAVLGTAFAASRPAYAAPVYDDGGECYRERVGYNRWGRPVFRTLCY